MKFGMEVQSLLENPVFTVTFEFFLLIITLFSLAVTVEHFMIPCLQSIAKKYNLSEQSTGYILALGSSIPEFSTNLISATSDNGNVNVGVGAITGSGSFDFTVCFGIASLFTAAGGLNLNKTLFYRDSFTYLFSLTILTFFIKDNVIGICEAFSLVLLFPLYLYISTIKLNSDEDSNENNNSPFKKPLAPSALESKELKPLIIEESNLMKLNISVIDQTTSNNYPFDFNSSNKSSILTHSQMNSNPMDNTNNQKINNLGNIPEDDLNEEESVLLIKESNEKDNLLEKAEEDVHNENNDGFYYYYGKVKEIFILLYTFVFPNHEVYPILCFFFILFSAFLHTRIMLYIIESLSTMIKLTASFLGLTLLSWGGNVGDTINASVATKLKAVDLLTTTILGSQVINLQLCLGIPWVISIMRNYYYTQSLEIDFGSKHPLKFLLPLYLVVLASIFIFTIFNVNLNRRSGVCLIIVYIIYLVYEFKTNIQ